MADNDIVDESGIPPIDDEEVEGALMAGFEGLADDEIDQLQSEMMMTGEAGEAAEDLAGDVGEGDIDEDDGESDDPDNEENQVDESVRDSIEGALRLKRLLSRDEEPEPGKKKRRTEEEVAQVEKKQAMVKQLSGRWQLSGDVVIKHVLEGCTFEELTEIQKSGYSPDKFNQWKSPAELLARYTAEMKERKMPGGSACDVITAFKFKYKMNVEADRQLRSLCHKDLRYVLLNFDGKKPLADVIKETKAMEAEDDNTTENAIPTGQGISTLSRFARLELIDPLADCAVFGDANLTFAIKLAEHRKALGHVGRVIATTFEELDTLRERYKEIDESIKTLEDMWAEVYHGVDCTRIALDPRFKGLEGSLGAVYYNFPHSGAIQGFFDGHPIVNWRHENLMRLFFRSLRSFMKPEGIVKVSSNKSAVGVRYSYIVGSAIENEFAHFETVPFLEWHLHRYGRSYGDKRDVHKRPDAKNNQSYNAQAADKDMVYCFTYKPSGDPLPKQAVRLPPTLGTLKACHDGPFKTRQGGAKENLAKQLHRRFVTEISGTHVG